MAPKRKNTNLKKKLSNVPIHLRPWMEHLLAFRNKNPHLSLKEAMIKAKKTYKK
jgi:hypothetical protein